MKLAVRLEPGNPAYLGSIGKVPAVQSGRTRLRLGHSNPFEKRLHSILSIRTPGWVCHRLRIGRQERGSPQSLSPSREDLPCVGGRVMALWNFLLRQGDQPEAFAELRRAIEADPQRAGAAFFACLPCQSGYR